MWMVVEQLQVLHCEGVYVFLLPLDDQSLHIKSVHQLTFEETFAGREPFPMYHMQGHGDSIVCGSGNLYSCVPDCKLQ